MKMLEVLSIVPLLSIMYAVVAFTRTWLSSRSNM